MKRTQVVIGILYLFSATGQAATKTYDKRINMAYNGKSVLNPSLVADEGERVGVSENIDTDEMTLEVVASPAAKHHVKLDFVISKKSLLSGEEAGNLTVTRSVSVLENKNAEVEIAFSKNKEMKLKILAKAINSQQE